MRRVVFSCLTLVLALWLVACGGVKLTAPSGVKGDGATAMLKFSRNSVPAENGYFSLKIEGKDSRNDLEDTKFLVPPGMTSGESWSGSKIDVYVTPKGFKVQSNNVYRSVVGEDHYQFNRIPYADDNGNIDVAFELLPGPQPVGGPFRVVHMLFNGDNSIANLTNATTEKGSDGRYHLKGKIQ